MEVGRERDVVWVRDEWWNGIGIEIESVIWIWSALLADACALLPVVLHVDGGCVWWWW